MPLKRDERSKSRLAPELSAPERLALADRMAARVIEALRSAPSIVEIRLLVPLPCTCPGALWERDYGGGLNTELQRVRRKLADRSLLIVHGDLPLINSRDVELLCGAAEMSGIAIAPDRRGEGTNAIALAKGYSVDFAFGYDSLGNHLESGSATPATVWTQSLMFDIDTKTDLADLFHLRPIETAKLMNGNC